MIKLVVTDIDDTLVNSRNEISKRIGKNIFDIL